MSNEHPLDSSPLPQELVDQILSSILSCTNLLSGKQLCLEFLDSLPSTFDDLSLSRPVRRRYSQVFCLLGLLDELRGDRNAALQRLSRAILFLCPPRASTSSLATSETTIINEVFLSCDRCFLPPPSSNLTEEDSVDVSLNSSPPRAKAELFVGWFYHQFRRNHALALRYLSSAISAAPRCSVAHYLRGSTYLALNEFQDSKDDLEESLRLSPTNRAQTLRQVVNHKIRWKKMADAMPRLTREERALQAAETERLRLESRINFVECHDSVDVDGEIAWNEIVKVNVTDSGSSGVFFLQSQDGKILVIKGSSFIAEEIFCSELAQRMDVKIRIPAIRLIERFYENEEEGEGGGVGNEFSICKQTIKRFAESDLAVLGKFHSNLARPFFLKMEFFYGHSPGDRERSPTDSLLRDFGRIFAFDLLVNNFDRFPCRGIWSERGNRGNVMMLHESDEAVAIDTSVNPLRNKEALDRYIDTVKEIVRVHCSGSSEGNWIIDDVFSFLVSCLCFAEEELGEDERQSFWEGIDEVFRSVGNVMDCLDDAKEAVVQAKKGEDWKGVFQESCDRIDVRFILAICGTIQRTID